jgi:hypothetical protein
MNFLDPRLPMKFWDKCIPEPNSGCWLWTGATGSFGYGNIGIKQKSWNAHRLAYVTLVGRPADGMHLDHLCKTPCCCNPAHLEAVPPRVNVLRGGARNNGAHNRAKTHCPKGHPYSGDNLYLSAGRRHCIACRRTS